VVRGLPQLVVADVRFAADAEYAEEEQGKIICTPRKPHGPEKNAAKFVEDLPREFNRTIENSASPDLFDMGRRQSGTIR